MMNEKSASVKSITALWSSTRLNNANHIKQQFILFFLFIHTSIFVMLHWFGTKLARLKTDLPEWPTQVLKLN
jgi:hypothetical protein